MLVVYDKKGQIYFMGTGMPEPEGIPYLRVDNIPEGKYITGIDVSAEPPVPVYAEYPKSETEVLKEKMQAQEKTIQMLTDCVLEMSEQLYA